MTSKVTLRDRDRKSAEQEIGWVYREFKRLSEDQLEQVNKERDDLLAYVSQKTTASFLGNKIHLGPISPGCLICGKGLWSCLFIQNLCTANCFYCPQDRKVKEELPPTTVRIPFSDPKAYAAYVKRFRFTGVGFSGGEPFLAFERLLAYMREVRKQMGDKVYIWAYSNGDLVTEDKLVLLKKAGLNELRLDISARKYNLAPVRLARKVIDTVSVEIPAIPEDFETLKKCLYEMSEIGVSYLNLHLLQCSRFNYKAMLRRGYTLLHLPIYPVLESEITALKIMKYAIDQKIGLPINYCTTWYKRRLQTRGYRRRIAPLVKEKFEELTDNYFIRGLSVRSTPQKIDMIVKVLKKKKVPPHLWKVDGFNREIYFHSRIMNTIDFTQHDLIITYFEYFMDDKQDKRFPGKLFKMSSDKKLYIRKLFAGRHVLKHQDMIKGFQNMFLDKKHDSESLQVLLSSGRLSLKEWKEEADLFYELKSFEHGESGTPYLF